MVWKFQRGHGPRTQISHPYGSEKFWEAYNACLVAEFGGVVVKEKKPSRGSVKWLIEEYRASPAWLNKLASKTRKTRDVEFRKIISAVGDRDVEDLTGEEIGLAMAKRTIGSANNLLQALRGMFEWAIKAGKVADNPAKAVALLQAPERDDPDEEEGHKTWSPEECAQYEAFYPIGTLGRLVYGVPRWTGLRVGDAARVGLQHVRPDGMIEIATEKSKTKAKVKVVIPILPELQEVLAAGPHGRGGVQNFIVGPRGTAWGKAHLGDQLAKFALAAGLKDCTAHGLRKRLASDLGERGVSDSALKAWFGWTEKSNMQAKYTKMAEKKKLTEGAARALLRGEIGNVISLTPKTGTGLAAKSLVASAA
jgi:integrase